MLKDSENNIDGYRKKEDDLLQKIEGWEKEYKHRNPCERYTKTGFCLHMLNAQNRKFGKESKQLFLNLIEITQK
ncbi:MAG: hypothetical protein ACREBF_02845 [Candidatus Micrarchaeales archaeon]